MELPDYEYKGLIAEAWDILRGDTSNWPDRIFYLDLIKHYGQPVLDVGCGTGRHLLDYMAQGIDMDGVDNSPEMLAICRRKAADMGLSVTLYEQFVEELNILRKYKVILIPSSSIQLIIDPVLARRALQNLYEILLPGGVLAASIMTIWQKGEPLFSEWEKKAVDPKTGCEYRRIARGWYDPESECERTEDIYQLIIEDKIVKEEIHQRDPATRSYTQQQAKQLFSSAGFQNVKLYHEFTQEPVKDSDMLFTVVAQK
ncbi:MAG TPA: methyltransferase domain-containing protein [Anaerolineaceae bacterium]|nr:methyltransferase domain-containing protein [Anaerolineaceae bacterium]